MINKKSVVFIACGLLGLSTIADFAMSASIAKSGYVERVVTTKNVGASSMETVKIYWEDDRMRMENYTVAGLGVQIKDGRTMILYQPDKKTAIKTVVPDKYAKSVQQMLTEQTNAVSGGKKTGTAKVAGIPCDVYTFAGSKGGSGKLYVSTDPRFPMPLKEVITVGTALRTVETKVVKLNQDIPNSMFVLPKGTKVKEEKFPEQPSKR